MNIVEYEKNFVIILNTNGFVIRGGIMNIEEIIVELNNYTTPIDKEINKELYKTTQLNIEDGNMLPAIGMGIVLFVLVSVCNLIAIKHKIVRIWKRKE